MTLKEPKCEYGLRGDNATRYFLPKRYSNTCLRCTNSWAAAEDDQ